MKTFTQRVIKGWETLLKNHHNKNILLVTHAGVIRAIFTEALNINHQSTLSFNIEYAHLSRLHYYTDGAYSLRFHGLSHSNNGVHVEY
jgi:alpha-ribazole phosphatase/probable phosphoglycerate mutase